MKSDTGSIQVTNFILHTFDEDPVVSYSLKEILKSAESAFSPARRFPTYTPNPTYSFQCNIRLRRHFLGNSAPSPRNWVA